MAISESETWRVTFSKPFAHSVIDDFIPIELVRRINDEWPKLPTEEGRHTFKKSSRGALGWAQSLNLGLGTQYVEDATGIKGLFIDPEMFGAGYHAVPRGGFLKMHVDFNRHPKGWMRRVNALLYLNENWEEAWGGHLQLGIGAAAKLIAPIAGRCVIFETNGQSWHGHPHPLRCPADRERRSLAFYYYTEAGPESAEAHTTIYKKNAA